MRKSDVPSSLRAPYKSRCRVTRDVSVLSWRAQKVDGGSGMHCHSTWQREFHPGAMVRIPEIWDRWFDHQAQVGIARYDLASRPLERLCGDSGQLHISGSTMVPQHRQDGAHQHTEHSRYVALVDSVHSLLSMPHKIQDLRTWHASPPMNLMCLINATTLTDVRDHSPHWNRGPDCGHPWSRDCAVQKYARDHWLTRT